MCTGGCCTVLLVQLFNDPKTDLVANTQCDAQLSLNCVLSGFLRLSSQKYRLQGADDRCLTDDVVSCELRKSYFQGVMERTIKSTEHLTSGGNSTRSGGHTVENT